MKVKKSSIFVISIYGIYILSVLIYIFSLIGEYRIGSKKAEIRFNRISRDLTSISRTYTPGTEDFYNEFLKSLGNIGDIAGIQLKYGNELILSYPKTLEELQKINNLLINALKHSPQQTTITVKTELDTEHKQACVRISDEGIGLAAVNQEELFTRFYQGAKEKSGTGLPA